MNTNTDSWNSIGLELRFKMREKLLFSILSIFLLADHGSTYDPYETAYDYEYNMDNMAEAGNVKGLLAVIFHENQNYGMRFRKLINLLISGNDYSDNAPGKHEHLNRRINNLSIYLRK